MIHTLTGGHTKGNEMKKAPTIRINYDAANKNRYIESGKGATYRCYGIATNDAAARKMASDVRKQLAEMYS